ncbi:MAG: hypothetical protein A3A33_02570 [Candidatus Yanofskybacteria bacterium RIFCSPLOWO2_01_FULL_49_25]|uniref:DUF2238 domain-containing protein n=1 Tax=Candidatus Yanofskybacteria bacterium RIFCSPLOWO2_01_FULL_49_25 TaxID=1802701 RepID=A0A1F8GS29_9BACT|nr:MAG: hypothetical protein A3A33_02570 [Candidatus Yanofskybacteria bacterium RIFCSPLOWO2_01_FULL_49_25]
MQRTRIVVLLAILAIIYGLSWLGVFDRWFLTYWWTDILMHIAGAFFMALLISSYYSNEFSKLSQPFRMFALLGMIVLVGVLWEFHEYILNHSALVPGLSHSLNYSVNLQGDVTDTMKDLSMDMLGGILAGLLTFARNWGTKS